MQPFNLPISSKRSPAVGKSDKHSSLDRWVRGLPGEIPPCMLMAPGACKIRREYNVLQIPIQIIPLGVPKRGIPALYGKFIKI